MDFSTGERHKKQLAEILEKRLIKDKNTVIYKELTDENLPTFFKNFIQNRVRKMFHTDEPLQIKYSSRYDFNYSRIKELKENLQEAFEEATIFTKDDIKDIIERTVTLQFDLLIDPPETLLNIFYKNKSERTQTDIVQVLNSLDDSRLFMQQLVLGIKEFDQFHIVKEDFKAIIKKIAEDINDNHLTKSFISDVEAYIDFINNIKQNKEETISKDILELLMHNRNISQYYEAFQKKSNGEQIGINEVYSLLKDNIEKIEEDYIEHVEDEIEEFIVSSVETSDAPEKELESVIDKEAETESFSSEHIEKSEKHHPKILFDKEPKDIIIDKSIIEHQPHVQVEPLDVIFDDKSKRLIERKIFNRDSDAFESFLNKLEHVDNWKEAKKIIDRELMIRSIQPFSREALKLGDLLFIRYFPENN